MARRVLVVGGTGLIGGAAALHLAELGHAVTLMGRTPSRAPALAGFPFVRASYLDASEVAAIPFERFDTLVFAAGNDLRQLPSGEDERAYFRRANSVGVPAFFEKARAGGLNAAVYVGSYYPDVVPAERIAASGYLTSRLEADEGVRALASPDFRACVLNAPFVIGHIAGIGGVIHLEMLVAYLMRRLAPEGPRYAIPGGAVFMSALSFAEAVAGAIERGEAGKAYLMGDESWTWERYLNTILEALGSDERVIVRDAPNPALPDIALYAGRTTTVAFEPAADTVERLRFRRGDVTRVVHEMVPYYRDQILAHGLASAG